MVFVVGTTAASAAQPVSIGAVQDGVWLVLDGLKAGEQVMVDGFQKFAPGAKVKPVPWTDAAAAVGLRGPAGAQASR